MKTDSLLGAHVNFCDDRTIVTPVHRMKCGLAFAGLPVFSVAANACAMEIGQAIQAAFRANMRGVDDLDSSEHRQMLKELARQAGYSSWRRFEASSTFCSITTDGESVVIQAMSRDSRGGFFQKDGDLRVECGADAIEIGRHLLTIKPDLR